MICALLFVLTTVGSVQGQQQGVDPALRAVVERFFATQVDEDIDAYLALWSTTAQRPQRQQLKFIFDSGSDKFLDLEINRSAITGDTARVRGAVTRIRTTLELKADGTPRAFTTRLQFSLAFVREEGEWKIVREGSPLDELAAALIDTSDPARRAELLAEDPEVVTSRLVDAIARRADQLSQQQQFKAALGVYERALEVARSLKDAKAEGHMLQNIGNARYFMRDFPAALANYEHRLTLERAAANDEGIASALIGIATIRYSTHEYTQALALYREALAIQERLNDEGLIATTLISTGNVLYIQGDFDAAIVDYRRAEALKRKYFDFLGAAMALEGLGRAYGAQGDYTAALVAFSGVLDEARKRRDTRREASALQHLGDTHFRLANLDAARTAYDGSRQQHEKMKDLSSAGRVWQGLAATELLSGRFPAAESAYASSIAACTSAVPEPDAECAARAHVGLGFAQAAQERYDDAIASYRKGIAAFEVLKAAENAARARVGLSEAQAGKEQYAAALETAIEARHTALVVESDDLLWRALIAQARAQRKLAKRAESLGAAKAAVSAVQQMAAAALRRPGHAVPRDTATAFATAAVLHAEAGDAASAWSAAEEMRTHSLRAVLAPNERDIARGMTTEERAAERDAAAELRPLLAQHDGEKGLPKPDKARLARLDAAIKNATARRTMLQEQLYTRLPDLRIWRGLAPPASFDDLKAVIGPDTLLIQFVVDERDLLVLTAEQSDQGIVAAAHVVHVRRQVLAEHVARAVEPASLGTVESWRRAAGEIVKLLPQSVVSQLTDARDIVVVPDDMLWRIPFEALPVAAGYVGDHAKVRYAASITSIVRAPAVGAPASDLKVLIAAAPELPQAVVDTLKTTAPSWSLRPREAAQKEAEDIQTAIGKDTATVLSGVDATEQAVRAGAAAASLLHVAAPFRVNAASPLFSPILLASGTQSSDASADHNAILEVREILNAEIATSVAVFSDPATLSMREAAAAMPALQWGLRAAGIETVLVRRWGMDDAAATGMLRALYKQMRAGQTLATALNTVRELARKAGAPPIVWAGWLLLAGR